MNSFSYEYSCKTPKILANQIKHIFKYIYIHDRQLGFNMELRMVQNQKILAM